MHFAILPQHKEFFRKHHYLELEGLFTPEQVHALTHSIDAVLSERLAVDPEQLKSKSGLSVFREGYDLWRDNETLRKMTHKRSLMHVAGELFQKTELRIAFDQYLSTGDSQRSPFEKPFSLSELSSLSPLAGALFIQLRTLDESPVDFPLPYRAGNVLFVAPELPIPWPALFAAAGLSLHLIVLGEGKTFFRHGTIDPYAPQLKKLGYVFGDLLQDGSHPVVLREIL